MSDIAALAGIAERGYARTAENISNIGEQLGNIYRGRATKTVEQDALEFFQNGVTMEKLREFSAKYPNYPQQEIWKVATQVGSHAETKQAENIFNDFVTGLHNGTIEKSEKGIAAFAGQYKNSSPGALNMVFGKAIPEYLAKIKPDLKGIATGELGVQYDRFGNVIPVPGLEAVEKPVMVDMYQFDKEGNIIQQEFASDQVEAAKAQGWKPGKLTQKKTPAAIVNISQGQEKEEAKVVGRGFGEQYIEIQKAGVIADKTINQYSRIKEFIQKARTGKLRPTTMAIAAYAKDLGFNIDPNLPYAQALVAMSNRLAMEVRSQTESGGVGLPGAVSEKDLEMLQASVVGIKATEEGNELLAEYVVKLARRNKEVAKLAREYRKKHGSIDEGFYDVLTDFSDTHPLFGGGDKIKTADDYLKQKGFKK